MSLESEIQELKARIDRLEAVLFPKPPTRIETLRDEFRLAVLTGDRARERKIRRLMNEAWKEIQGKEKE